MRPIRDMDEALDRAQAQADRTGYNYSACRRDRGPDRTGPEFTVTPGLPQEGYALEWTAIAPRSLFPEVEDRHVVVARHTRTGDTVLVPLRGADLDRRTARLPDFRTPCGPTENPT